MSKYKQNDILAIKYDIWISGTKLHTDKKLCINSIEIKETVDGADKATIKLQDPTFMYIEDDIFLEDNTITIRMGWDNSTFRQTFSGYISAIDIDFDSKGIPNMALTCMDETHVMNRSKDNETFENCTSANVVEKIARRYGYRVVIEQGYDFAVQETITKSNQSDIDFLTKLASDEVYPFAAYIRDGVFYYVKKGKLETPKMTLTYRNYPHEIVSFSPKINKESKQVEIKSSAIDTGSKGVNSTSGSTSDGGSGNSNSSSNNGSASPSGGATKGASYTFDPKTRKWTKN